MKSVVMYVIRMESVVMCVIRMESVVMCVIRMGLRGWGVIRMNQSRIKREETCNIRLGNTNGSGSSRRSQWTAADVLQALWRCITGGYRHILREWVVVEGKLQRQQQHSLFIPAGN